MSLKPPRHPQPSVPLLTKSWGVLPLPASSCCRTSAMRRSLRRRAAAASLETAGGTGLGSGRRLHSMDASSPSTSASLRARDTRPPAGDHHGTTADTASAAPAVPRGCQHGPAQRAGASPGRQDSPATVLRENRLPVPSGTAQERDGRGDGGCSGVSSHGCPGRSGDGQVSRNHFHHCKVYCEIHPHCSSLRTILKSRSGICLLTMLLPPEPVAVTTAHRDSGIKSTAPSRAIHRPAPASARFHFGVLRLHPRHCHRHCRTSPLLLPIPLPQRPCPEPDETVKPPGCNQPRNPIPVLTGHCAFQYWL